MIKSHSKGIITVAAGSSSRKLGLSTELHTAHSAVCAGCKVEAETESQCMEAHYY